MIIQVGFQLDEEEEKVASVAPPVPQNTPITSNRIKQLWEPDQPKHHASSNVPPKPKGSGGSRSGNRDIWNKPPRMLNQQLNQQQQQQNQQEMMREKQQEVENQAIQQNSAALPIRIPFSEAAFGPMQFGVSASQEHQAMRPPNIQKQSSFDDIAAYGTSPGQTGSMGGIADRMHPATTERVRPQGGWPLGSASTAMSQDARISGSVPNMERSTRQDE